MEREAELLARLRAGDEATFSALVEKLHGTLVRLAEHFVGRGAAAEEVVQDTWLAVLEGLDRFEGRSSLRTWIGSILVNRARTRRAKDKREQTIFDADQEMVIEEGKMNAIGFWAEGPPVVLLPDDALARKRARELLASEIEQLPDNQRVVLTLRDVSEWSSDEVCNVLGLSETNQRVLLHRGRMRLRAALARKLGEERAS